MQNHVADHTSSNEAFDRATHVKRLQGCKTSDQIGDLPFVSAYGIM
jgi:hypothetical protein